MCLNCLKAGYYFLIVRHVSFVDCPAHDILMVTMLNGAAVMDADLLLIGNYMRINLEKSLCSVVNLRWYI